MLFFYIFQVYIKKRKKNHNFETFSNIITITITKQIQPLSFLL